MDWQYEIPQTEGFYWYQESPADDIELVEIWEDSQKLIVEHLGNWQGSHSIGECGGRWSGPIDKPDRSEGWKRPARAVSLATALALGLVGVDDEVMISYKTEPAERCCRLVVRGDADCGRSHFEILDGIKPARKVLFVTTD